MAQFNYEGNVYACVGRFLKRELKRSGIDQLDFADEVGYNERTVRRWIYGEVHSLDVVVLIAEYFGVSIGDVLSDEDGIPLLLQKIRDSDLGHSVSFRNLFFYVSIILLYFVEFLIVP